MNKKISWKKVLSLLVMFALLLGNVTGIGNRQAAALSGKAFRSVKIMQGSKDITKKTLKMNAGTSKKLTVQAKPATVKKNITFKSSNKKIVSVSQNGNLKAKKSGSARITVTVSKKGYKKSSTWVKVSVQKASTPAPAPTEAPANPPDVTDTPPVPTEVPTESPDVTDSPVVPTETPVVSPEPEVPSQPTETPDDNSGSGKLLVAYFSWSGTSERIAQNIISQTGADSFRIERETPYSTDYSTVAYGDAKTEADTNARPPIKEPLASVAEYDKIILCYPIWWHTAPMTVGTFLESYDLTGKKIYPISQSASMDNSQYQQSVTFIKDCAKGAVVDDGLFSKDNAAIQSYIENTVLK